MDQPDTDGQFPPFSLTVKGTREHDFDKMSDVLPDSPRALPGRHPSRHVERLAHQGGDVFQGDDEERSDKQVRVRMKGSAPGVNQSRIEPRGRNLNSTEEIPQRLRRVRERLRVLLHARVDELMHVCLIERGQRVGDVVGHRITDDRMFQVLRREIRIRFTRLGVPRLIDGRDGHARFLTAHSFNSRPGENFCPDCCTK